MAHLGGFCATVRKIALCTRQRILEGEIPLALALQPRSAKGRPGARKTIFQSITSFKKNYPNHIFTVSDIRSANDTTAQSFTKQPSAEVSYRSHGSGKSPPGRAPTKPSLEWAVCSSTTTARPDDRYARAGERASESLAYDGGGRIPDHDDVR